MTRRTGSKPALGFPSPFQVEQDELVQARPHLHRVQQEQKEGSSPDMDPSPLLHGTSTVLILLIKSVCPAELCAFMCLCHTVTPITLIPQLGPCSQGRIALPALEEEIGTVTESSGVQVSYLYFNSLAVRRQRQ